MFLPYYTAWSVAHAHVVVFRHQIVELFVGTFVALWITVVGLDVLGVRTVSIFGRIR